MTISIQHVLSQLITANPHFSYTVTQNINYRWTRLSGQTKEYSDYQVSVYHGKDAGMKIEQKFSGEELANLLNDALAFVKGQKQ